MRILAGYGVRTVGLDDNLNLDGSVGLESLEQQIDFVGSYANDEEDKELRLLFFE